VLAVSTALIDESSALWGQEDTAAVDISSSPNHLLILEKKGIAGVYRGTDTFLR
jgi:hypothetical protein